MAEPVSRAAWSRLVALLNAYVSDGRNLYGVDGGVRDGLIWQDDVSGLSNNEDWNLPKLITRSLARTAFDEMVEDDDFGRLFYIACVYSSKNSIEDVIQVSKFVGSQPNELKNLILQLRDSAQLGSRSGYEFIQKSTLSNLGVKVSSGLLYLCSPREDRHPSFDSQTVWWLTKYGQFSSDMIQTGSWMEVDAYQKYANFCKLSINQFEESGHLPDGCFESEFVHYLIQCDVEGLRQTNNGRPWYLGLSR
jgi:hypothetical protein